MGRVLSPNDIYYNYDPWRSVRTLESQNPIINDPPASYLTLVSLLRDDPSSFHWNRYIASGVPGFGSVGAAVLSPFVLIAGLAVPLVAFYTALVFLKLNFSFWAAYLWLRHEWVGKRAAAGGAIVFAAAGSYAVWWLWQTTNATAIYPLVFVTILRLVRRQRVSLTLMALLATALLLSGFPAALVYVAYLGGLYAIFLMLREKSVPPMGGLVRAFGACVIALLIVAPSLATFIRFLHSTGYLAGRENAALLGPYPIANLRLFIDPFFRGDPVAHRWSGAGTAVAAADNLVEASVYVGLLTLPLMLLGCFRSGWRSRFFWVGTAVVLVLLMFAHTPLEGVVGHLPGIRYSPLTRLRMLFPLAAAVLTANGLLQLDRVARRFMIQRRSMLIGLATLVVAYDLGFFAARFHPYLTREVAEVPATSTIRYLHALPGPFRVAPMFDDFWPNSAELFRIEDIRSHFSSEERYRRMLQRIDPEVWGKSGTVLQFDALRMNFDDPFLALLNTRYYLEQPSIDILRWKVEEKTSKPAVNAQTVVLQNGALISDVDIVSDAVRSLVVFPTIGGDVPTGSRVRARLERPEDGTIVGSVSLPAGAVAKSGKLYIPIRQRMKQDEHLLLTIESDGASLQLQRDGDGRVAYGSVASPIVPTAEWNDGRVFEDLNALPRYFAVWNVASGNFEQLMQQKSFDFSSAALVDGDSARFDDVASVPPRQRRARFKVERYDGAEQRVVTDAAVPFYFVASEKNDRDLTVRIDGQRVEVVPTDGLFSGFRVPAGRHVVVLQRVLGRRWWPASAAGLVLLVGATFVDRRRGQR